MLRHGPCPPVRREAAKATVTVLAPLVVGFTLSACLVWGLVAQAGHALGIAASTTETALVLTLVVVLAVLEVVPYHVRRSVCARQTPKALVGRLHPALGGLLWGLDAGTVVSTYRASMASWAALLLCAGWGGVWTGLLYAAGFCVPLAAYSLAWAVPHAPAWLLAEADTGSLVTAILGRVRATQWVAAVVAVAGAGLVTVAA